MPLNPDSKNNQSHTFILQQLNYTLNIASFHPTPALQLAGKGALGGGSVGLLVSTVRNALEQHNKGAMGVITRTGGTIGLFSGFIYIYIRIFRFNLINKCVAAVGATFAFTESAVSNVRNDNDAISSAAGGCASGSLIGVRCESSYSKT